LKLKQQLLQQQQQSHDYVIAGRSRVSQCIVVVRTDGSESVYTTASADLSPSPLSADLNLSLPAKCRTAMKSRRQPIRASDDVMYRRNDVELGADYELMPYSGSGTHPHPSRLARQPSSRSA
jgi:hypothetical protein